MKRWSLVAACIVSAHDTIALASDTPTGSRHIGLIAVEAGDSPWQDWTGF